MHAASGLIDEIPTGLSLAEAEERVLAYLASLVPGPAPRRSRATTIGTDRSFLAKFMPRVDAHLHYRSVDVSSIKELARRWFPRVYFQAPAKAGGHRGARRHPGVDPRTRLLPSRALRRALPGPTSEEAQAASAETVDAWRSWVP